MFFRALYDDDLAQVSYLIGCQGTGEAVVIDPVRDVDRYIDLAGKDQLTVVAVAETHIHADFVSGARELAERVGAKVYVSGEGGPDWQSRWIGRRASGSSYRHEILQDGEHFSVGRIRFQAVHTPGHTPEHMSFLVIDAGGGAREEEPIGVLTGDFVFVGELGRPDLLEKCVGVSGAAQSGLADLRRSARWFGLLPQFTQVWPAHSAGSPCGKELGAVPQSTVGYEIRYNAALRSADDAAAFEHNILDDQPEPPPYFARMKQVNRDGPAVLGGLPSPKKVAVAALAGSEGQILDIRPWESHLAGHLPGSLSLPLHRTFTIAAASYLDPGARLHLVVDNERDKQEAIRRLIRVGLDNIQSYILGADLPTEGLSVTGEVPAEHLIRVVEQRGTILDVRRGNEVSQGAIPGAINIPHVLLGERLSEVPKGQTIYVTCRTGKRSARAVSLLERHGIKAVNVAGGWEAYRAAGGRIQ
ncbi:MAG: MBL fold metallo-hydrolase [Leptolyngbya sp. PLA3]|nr:MAG: MBL fold metallo-hydrolase [Cyanobacteria bacterium CYA]MCE7968543.1 MBL fold metallo-hydrolase [Leptolyngbya sp. PL-A3]